MKTTTFAVLIATLLIAAFSYQHVTGSKDAKGDLEVRIEMDQKANRGH
jgi:hypothetical protein